MKKFTYITLMLAVAALVVVLLAPWPAYSQVPTPYVSVAGHVTHEPDLSNSDPVEFGDGPGWRLCLATGVTWTPLLRVEVEGCHGENKLHGRNVNSSSRDRRSADGHVMRSDSLLANLWPGISFDHVQLYVGGGLGVGRLSGFGDHGYGMAWQAGAGFIVDLSYNLALDIGYRYFAIDEMRLGGLNARYDTHALSTGLTWRF